MPEISKLDCHRVIAEKFSTEDFSVIDFQQISFVERSGFLGDHSSLKIKIKRKNKEEDIIPFFVKSIPKTPSQRKFTEEINGFFKEKQFFTKYCSMLKKYNINILDDAVPVGYFVNEENFIFDDLTSKGYESLSSRSPLKIDCVKSALIAFAKLHASGLVLEKTKSFRLIDEFEEELKETFYASVDSTKRAMVSLKSGLRALIDITHTDNMKISKELFTAKALEGLDLQKTVVKPSTRFRNTVCHADTWTKNFMFKFEKGEANNCVIVDFQTYRYSPPAQDILSFMYIVTDRNFRNKHMKEMLKFYYKELSVNLEHYGFKGVLTSEEFFESCRFYTQYALTQALAHCQVVILSEELIKELFADSAYTEYVLFENKYEFFIDACQRDSFFREKNFEILAELREHYEQDN